MHPALAVVDLALAESVKRGRPMPVIDHLLDIRNMLRLCIEIDALERIARNS